jgi:hypothetical protein
MVIAIEGELDFELVDATTRLPLFSKTDPTDGQLWFCAEEGQEYFLQFMNLRGLRKVCNIKVDGRKLGSSHRWKTAKLQHTFVGVQNPDLTHSALKFSASASVDEDGNDVPAGRGSGGEISFDLRSFTPTKILKPPALHFGLARSNLETAPATAVSKKDKKGALTSTVGTATVGSKGNSAKKVIDGPIIASVYVRYMTEIGLVHKRIVAPGEVPWEPPAPVDPPPSAKPARVKREMHEKDSSVGTSGKRVKRETSGGSAEDAIEIE